MPRVSVLLVTHNARAEIDACLEALQRQTCREWEAIAVDNGSTDGTCERLARFTPLARLIRNTSNRGFPAAVNQALHDAVGEFVLTLNPDVVLAPDCLARLLEAAIVAPSTVGMFSPTILRPNRRTIDSTGLLVSRAWRVADRGRGELHRGQFDQQREILGPCAAAGWYRRAMLDALREPSGTFDARFFLLMEDVDLAWRAQRAGWRARYVPEAVAYHRGGCSRRFSWRAQALAFRNRYYLIAKHHRRRWRDAAWVAGYDIPRLAWLLCTNPYTLPTLWQLARQAPRLAAPPQRSATRAPQRVRVLDVPVDALTRAQAVERLITLATTGSGAVALYVNAHIFNLAWKDAALRAWLQAADAVLADGQGAVWAARWQATPLPERVNVADICADVVAQARERGLRLFLLGGRPGSAQRAAAALAARWPGLSIAGTHHGYFAAQEAPRLARLIVEAQPDLVLVGMGSPRQEAWVMRHRWELPVRLFWCVGRTLDLFAGLERWTPCWMRRTGLEWCFRLCCHPLRLWRRYLAGLPAFAWRVLVWGRRRRRETHPASA